MTLLSAKDLVSRYKNSLSKARICQLTKEGKIKSIAKLSCGYIYNLDDILEFEQLRKYQIFRRYGLKDLALGYATA